MTIDHDRAAPLYPANAGGTDRWDYRASAPDVTGGRVLAGLSPAEKWERLAFTVCKVGTTGLLAWLLTPPIFVLLAAVIAIALYARALALGLTRSRCVLRRPVLIIAFWAIVAAADLAWLLGGLGPR